MRLLGKRLLVAPEIRTKVGSVFLPPSATGFQNTGDTKVYTVIAVGSKIDEPINVGDRVVCHSYTSGPEEYKDGQYFITHDQILAVIPNTKQTNEQNTNEHDTPTDNNQTRP